MVDLGILLFNSQLSKLDLVLGLLEPIRSPLSFCFFLDQLVCLVGFFLRGKMPYAFLPLGRAVFLHHNDRSSRIIWPASLPLLLEHGNSLADVVIYSISVSFNMYGITYIGYDIILPGGERVLSKQNPQREFLKRSRETANRV